MENDTAMPVVSIDDIATLVTPGTTLVGLDLGTKTIGIAVSDIGLAMAHPRPVIARGKFSKDAEILKALFAREHVAAAIMGLPLNMDGSEGPRAQSTRAFVRNFERFSPIPFVLWDERLSTVAATRALLEQDMSRAKRAERIDSAAAAFILQGALDRLQQMPRSAP